MRRAKTIAERALRCALLTLPLALLGCAPEAGTRYATTQVNVRIDALEGLREQADELRAELWVRESASSRWSERKKLTVRLEGLRWPFEVPVLPRFPDDENSQFEVVVALMREGAVIARDRVVASFERGKVLLVRVSIAPCTSESQCDGDECHGEQCRECRASACKPVGVTLPDQGAMAGTDNDAAVGTPDAGSTRDEQDARPSGNDGGQEVRDAANGGGDAAVEPAPRDDAGGPPVDAGGGQSDAASAPSCPAQHSCPAAYPCIPTRAGYTCRGLRADWPMPDGVEGAKFKQRYTAQAETVVDEVTKLEWQIGIPRLYDGCSGRSKSPSGTLGEYGEFCTREEGRAYCDKLERGGRDDWRMPTVIELVSLLDMRADPDWANAIDGDFFGDSDGFAFIADSASASGPTSGWMVAYNFRTIYVDRNLTGKVRCVRAGAEPPFATPADRYELTDSTVTDRATTLVWQRSFSPTRLTAAAAEQYCSALGAGFRLPTPNELFTLVDPLREMPAIDATAFPNTPMTEFWTTPKIVAERYIEFGTGEMLVPGPSDAHVRCVR